MKEVDERDRLFFDTYKRIPIELERAEGVFLIAKDGTRYLDMFSGIAVNALGYNHAIVNKAIVDQVHKYLHVSNLFHQEPQYRLAQRLLSEIGYARLFFTNSGTEAMEGALKLARKWGKETKKTTIISFSESFHGRTYGSLSITGRKNYREGYEPFLPGTEVIRFNDLDELRQSVNSETLAVVLEFIQGEGGVNPVSSEFVAELDALKREHGFLVIADEIQTGIGRTGTLFAFQQYSMKPDIVVLAKALGGGLPLGAFIGNENLSHVFTVGSHGTTFGGNPVSCAAGLATLLEILDNGVMENCRQAGDHFRRGLLDLQKEFPNMIKEVRGSGLMVGVEMKFDGAELVDRLRDRHLLVNLTQGTVLRWMPPLLISRSEIEVALSIFREVLSSLAKPDSINF